MCFLSSSYASQIFLEFAKSCELFGVCMVGPCGQVPLGVQEIMLQNLTLNRARIKYKITRAVICYCVDIVEDATCRHFFLVPI